MVRAPWQGEIIKVNLDPKQGHEQAGYRPYLCLSHILISNTSNVAVFAPISNTERDYPFYYRLDQTSAQTSGQVLLDQLVTIDYNARNFKPVENLSREEMRPILAIARLIFDENV